MREGVEVAEGEYWSLWEEESFVRLIKTDWVKELRARPRQCRLYIGSASAMYSIPHTCVPATSYITVRLESADWNSGLLEEDYDYLDEKNLPVRDFVTENALFNLYSIKK